MARKRFSVQLTPEEYEFLITYVARGQKKARYINRARTLLWSHDGKDDQEIANILGISRTTNTTTLRLGEQRTWWFAAN